MTLVPSHNLSKENRSTTISQSLIRADHHKIPTETGRTAPQENSEQGTSNRTDQEKLRVIGLGTCGTVFEIPGTEIAFKKGSNEASIWNDFCLTNTVYNAVKQVRTIIQEAFPHSTIPRVPLCHAYYPVNDEVFWSANLHRFPPDYRTKQPLFMADRILPLPEQTRTNLIEEYFDQDEKIQQEAKDDQENKDCLVRIYLGERESASQRLDAHDTLRNFPMRLNMIEDMNIEVSQLAEEMAVGLAIIQWQAQVDGMDTESVLGSSATWDMQRPEKGYVDDSAPPHTVKAINFNRWVMHLWMLDFDKARRIDLTKNDVDTKLVPAFLGNDPYFPRPSVGEELWDAFCGSYLKASELILRNKGVGEQVMRLPQRFLDEVTRVVMKHKDWNEKDNIVFGY